MKSQIKEGFTIYSHTPNFGFSIGETIYTVCDKVGVVFTTIYENQLAKFYE